MSSPDPRAHDRSDDSYTESENSLGKIKKGMARKMSKHSRKLGRKLQVIEHKAQKYMAHNEDTDTIERAVASHYNEADDKKEKGMIKNKIDTFVSRNKGAGRQTKYLNK